MFFQLGTHQQKMIGATYAPRGKHFIVELMDCDRQLLNSPDGIAAVLRNAVTEVGATVVFEKMHCFSPQGVTGFLLLSESHITVHTWPESGHASLDFYTCGDLSPEKSCELLRVGFGAKEVKQLLLTRGVELGVKLDRVSAKL